MRKFFAYLHEHFYLEVIALFFFLLAFFIEPILSLSSGNGFVFDPIHQIFKGYFKIITSPSILICI